MDYSIQLNAVNKEESSVKAFATVTFANSFKVSNISVMENREGKLFVAMPRYRSNERTEHNETVYKDVCNPITKDFRQELYDGILELYANMKQEEKNTLTAARSEKTNAPEKAQEVGLERPDFSVKVTPFENPDSKLRGMARIYFADSFVVSNVRIMQGKEKEFIAMPSEKTNKLNETGKPIYKDICCPVTKEFREELYQVILDVYHQEMAALVPFEQEKEIAKAEPKKAEENIKERPVKKAKSR